jgi:hypothetical protein
VRRSVRGVRDYIVTGQKPKPAPAAPKAEATAKKAEQDVKPAEEATKVAENKAAGAEAEPADGEAAAPGMWASLRPTGNRWSYSAGRIGHMVPIWQPYGGSLFRCWDRHCATSMLG